MSEFLSDAQGRIDTLKSIIRNIAEGADPGNSRTLIETQLGVISPTEVAEAAQALEDEGYDYEQQPRSIARSLFEVVQPSLDHMAFDPLPQGHPIHSYLQENRIIKSCLDELEQIQDWEGDIAQARILGKSLEKIDIHYQRKENQLFPFLERRGFSHPSGEMWRFHDEIRTKIKAFLKSIRAKNFAKLQQQATDMIRDLRAMIHREEHILLPVSMRLLNEQDWAQIRAGEAEIGWMLPTPPDMWKPQSGSYQHPDTNTLEPLIQIALDYLAGADLSAIKQRFRKEIGSISAGEYAAMMQELQKRGLVSDSAIHEKVDELVAIFQDSFTETPKDFPQGHPLNTYYRENRAIAEQIQIIRRLESYTEKRILMSIYDRLANIDAHYQRKEHQLFPFLEKQGFDLPSTIMWALHDDLRAMLKYQRDLLDMNSIEAFIDSQPALLAGIEDMIFKEEHILFPVSLELATEQDWIAMRRSEEEYGYCMIDTPPLWPTAAQAEYTHPSEINPDNTRPPVKVGALAMEEGYLTPTQINLIFNHLPMDITFVDEHDRVSFYSRGQQRTFPRSPGIIGREVKFCHPPKSVDTVMRIVEEFRSGAKNHADFWLHVNDQYVYIRYFAVRDEAGNYKGVLEVGQNISDIQKISGERRLLDWD